MFVGLTGTIGSGKSTVAKFFQDAGAPIISADEIARGLTADGSPAYYQILEHFGPAILNEDYGISRPTLKKIIFNNLQEKLWLENLLHPLIKQEIEASLVASNDMYTIIEIPLLALRADYPYIDRVLLILSEPALQIKRIMGRDKLTMEQAKKILAAQEAIYISAKDADDIIQNTGSLAELKKKSITCIKNIYITCKVRVFTHCKPPKYFLSKLLRTMTILRYVKIADVYSLGQ